MEGDLEESQMTHLAVELYNMSESPEYAYPKRDVACTHVRWSEPQHSTLELSEYANEGQIKKNHNSASSVPMHNMCSSNFTFVSKSNRGVDRH